MFNPVRLLNRLAEFLFEAPLRLARLPVQLVLAVFNIRFWLRTLFAVLTGFVLVGLIAYAIPPLWAPVGLQWFSSELDYFDQRSKGIGIYDVHSDYLGIFDPRMEPDFNATAEAIEWEDLTAYPDHKSEHVDEVPTDYWSCLRYLEDRNLGKPLISFRTRFPFFQFGNLYGIDPHGLIRFPANAMLYLAGKAQGGGGSTLAMQLARSYYKTLPSVNENTFDKLKRKTSEWWLAPIIQHKLTSSGSIEPLKNWAANHLPLAQRVGGDLYGVGLTSRMVFGKPSSELTRAEQYVLAAAVNRPIQVLPSANPRIENRRKQNWEYITAHRAQRCVNTLVSDPQEQKNLTIALQTMSLSVPQAKLADDKEAELKLVPNSSGVIRTNPVRRANHFAPSARFGARAEMVNLFGREWRNYVARVDLTINAAENIRLREKLGRVLGKLNTRYRNMLDRNFTLDVLEPDAGKRLPDIIVAAADEKGRLVRYFDAGSNAHYYGSSSARDPVSGTYERDREGRAVASVAKMLGAILIANDGEDTVDTGYLDPDAPSSGLDTCRRHGGLRRLRRAEAVFACSMSEPLANRLFKLGQGTVRQTVDRFGFNMPYAPSKELETPPSTAVAHGLVTASPQKAHQLAAVILAALTGRGDQAVGLPTMVAQYSRTTHKAEEEELSQTTSDIIPDQLIDPNGRELLGRLLSAPLCYQAGKRREGTLKSEGRWCAARNDNVLLHFAKTGTQTTDDPDTTVDVWLAGGIKFASGKAYSYVIVVGSGSAGSPLGYRLHSSQIAAPLLDVLIEDLRHLAGTKQLAAEPVTTASP